MKYTITFKEIPSWMRKDVQAVLNTGWFKVLYKTGNLQWEEVLGAVDEACREVKATPKDIKANAKCLKGLRIKSETGYSPVIKEVKP